MSIMILTYDEVGALEVEGGTIIVDGVTLTMAQDGLTDATIFLRSGKISIMDG